jgi:cytochrome c
VVAAAAIAVAAVSLQAADAVVWDGVYTEVQAKRGSTVYSDHCVECHAEDLSGDTPYNPSPALVGGGFLTRWDAKTLADLFDLIRTRMPKRREGQLTPEQYIDVTAFILRSNHFPASTTELPGDVAKLREVRISKEKPPQ